jgi:hypothetical protein
MISLLFLLYADLLYIMKLMHRLCVFSLFRFLYIYIYIYIYRFFRFDLHTFCFPCTVVREERGPYSDPQHPYFYEEDVWMAPGFINQFYEVS